MGLIHSLQNQSTAAYQLFVLCMDDETYQFFEKYPSSNVIPIKLSDFENDKLLKIKPSRKKSRKEQ